MPVKQNKKQSNIQWVRNWEQINILIKKGVKTKTIIIRRMDIVTLLVFIERIICFPCDFFFSHNIYDIDIHIVYKLCATKWEIIMLFSVVVFFLLHMFYSYV